MTHIYTRLRPFPLVLVLRTPIILQTSIFILLSCQTPSTCRNIPTLTQPDGTAPQCYQIPALDRILTRFGKEISGWNRPVFLPYRNQTTLRPPLPKVHIPPLLLPPPPSSPSRTRQSRPQAPRRTHSWGQTGARRRRRTGCEPVNSLGLDSGGSWGYDCFGERRAVEAGTTIVFGKMKHNA